MTTVRWPLFCRACRKAFIQRGELGPSRGEYALRCPHCGVEGRHAFTGRPMDEPPTPADPNEAPPDDSTQARAQFVIWSEGDRRCEFWLIGGRGHLRLYAGDVLLCEERMQSGRPMQQAEDLRAFARVEPNDTPR